ncbi:MAG: type II secretion system major pseudopilin GspG [Comamonadaceae bacterium]|nr:type II secretion system major pseudopilin GspG [Comamonadaceae bacterium]
MCTCHSPLLATNITKNRGFTLIELLVVLVILTLLAGLVGPRVMSQLGGAKSKTAGLQIADLEKSMELFKLDVGRYPSTAEGLDALANRPAAANGWNGPYIKGNLPTDPWGKPYLFTSPTANGGVDIMTLGADATAGGTGENADIRNQP